MIVIAPILTHVGVLKFDDRDTYSYTIWEECAAGVEIMLFVSFLIHFLTYIPSFGTFSLRFHLHFDEIDHEPVIRSLSTDPTIALLRGDGLGNGNESGHHFIDERYSSEGRQGQHGGGGIHTGSGALSTSSSLHSPSISRGSGVIGGGGSTTLPSGGNSGVLVGAGGHHRNANPHSAANAIDDDPFLSADLLDGAAGHFNTLLIRSLRWCVDT